MQLSEKIMSIYPYITTVDFNPISGTIVLQDDSDGQGPYIKVWNRDEPKPTQEQLDSLN